MGFNFAHLPTYHACNRAAAGQPPWHGGPLLCAPCIHHAAFYYVHHAFIMQPSLLFPPLPIPLLVTTGIRWRRKKREGYIMMCAWNSVIANSLYICDCNALMAQMMAQRLCSAAMAWCLACQASVQGFSSAQPPPSHTGDGAAADFSHPEANIEHSCKMPSPCCFFLQTMALQLCSAALAWCPACCATCLLD